jgi:hypothetical protein
MGFFSEELPEYTAADVDAYAAKANVPPPGKYLATLDGASEKTSKTGNTGDELVFRLTGGEYDGHEVKETLWHTGKDEDATKKMVDRGVMFATRLGLMVPGKGGKLIIKQGCTGFGDILGSQCVIEIEHEEYTTKDGKKGTAARLKYKGIFAVTDPSVKAIASGDKSGAVTKPTATKTKFDASQLGDL